MVFSLCLSLVCPPLSCLSSIPIHFHYFLMWEEKKTCYAGHLFFINSLPSSLLFFPSSFNHPSLFLFFSLSHTHTTNNYYSFLTSTTTIDHHNSIANQQKTPLVCTALLGTHTTTTLSTHRIQTQQAPSFNKRNTKIQEHNASLCKDCHC